MAPARKGGADYVPEDDDVEDEDDFLDDDDSGDEYRSAPALPRIGAGAGAGAGSRLAARSGIGRQQQPGTLPGSGGAGGAAATKGKNKDKPKSKSKDAGYSWEATYKRSWDNVHEDESGSLEGAVRQMIEGQKRKRITRDVAPVQRGIIRHLVLLLDLSSSMLEKDLRPNRFDLALQYAREFVSEYFDQNPIGQLAIIGTREGIAERIAMMGGNTVDHVAALNNKRKLEPRGEPSLQNALEMARSTLSHLPASNSREVLAIFGSLTTCDPGNIHDTVRQLQKDSIRVSMVSLAAEVKIFKDLCTQTGGTFSVALNEAHLRDCLFELVPPPAVEQRSKASQNAAAAAAASAVDLLQMGFPLRLPSHSEPTLCACHSRSRAGGYLCPRCGCKVCDVPTDCPVCGITIVMSTHLARSYHHLFPVSNWLAVGWDAVGAESKPNCLACQLAFPAKPADADVDSGPARAAAAAAAGDDSGGTLAPSSRYACPRCGNHFCLECDAFVHEQLHICPGCC